MCSSDLVTIILLFIIVRDEQDYYYYALLTVITTAIICLMNWVHCRKYLSIRFTFDMGLKKHIKPIMVLFANSIATIIYVSADTTMLGIMSGDVAVGLYSIAGKIYSVTKKLLVAMYGAAVPRIAYFWGKGDIKSLRNVYSKLISNLIIILLPASVGTICIAKEIILLMGGAEYAESVLTLQILSVALIGAILGGAVTYGLNIPIGLEKYNLFATIISAGLNVLINVFILPIWKQNGAAFSTVISEFFVLIFCIVTNKKFLEFIDVRQISRSAFHAALGGVSIVVITYIVHLYITNSVLSMLMIIAFSIILYMIELIALKNEFVFMILNKIKSKLSL